MRAIVGHSQDIETADTIADVLRQCETQLGDEIPRAGILFASTDYDHGETLAAIQSRWPGLKLIGGTTDGEVSSQIGYTPDSLLLLLFAGDDFEVEVGLGRELSADPARAVAQATAQLCGRTPAVCLTTFAPTSNSAFVVQELQRAIGTPCPILGGLSGDHRDYSRMAEFCGSEHLRDSLPVLFLFGDLRVSWGVGSGWFPIGELHTVTASNGHVVQTIDGRPALDLFRHYWGDVNTDSLGEYPLAVYPHGPDAPHTLRAALSCDTVGGAIRFAGDVPQGAVVRLTEVLPEGVLAGTTASIRAAMQGYGGREPSVALLFSCAARRWVLGAQAENELELLSRELSRQARSLVDIAGFYCFGEIAPLDPVVDGSMRNGFHNETCVTVLIGK